MSVFNRFLHLKTDSTRSNKDDEEVTVLHNIFQKLSSMYEKIFFPKRDKRRPKRMSLQCQFQLRRSGFGKRLFTPIHIYPVLEKSYIYEELFQIYMKNAFSKPDP